jgi:hypothetical protein
MTVTDDSFLFSTPLTQIQTTNCASVELAQKRDSDHAQKRRDQHNNPNKTHRNRPSRHDEIKRSFGCSLLFGISRTAIASIGFLHTLGTSSFQARRLRLPAFAPGVRRRDAGRCRISAQDKLKTHTSSI